ncbi:nucleolar GTP-binding protein 2-like [Haliotis rufescens]|uniref:nucleolar GTP-binding protein 2-like n=1 Tax=Haliotis rufescens TaxID=6454 RepID=UPI00201EE1DC|nr:nucleolar GTP-binding protein 2-like [Haliotis rufescens]
MSKMILNDWQRGKIPYFVRPPESQDHSRAETTDTPTPTPEVKGKASRKKQPKVMQDLKEDPCGANIQEDGGSSAEEEDSEGEGSVGEDSAGEDSDEDVAVDETKGEQNQSSEESCTVLDKSSSHAAKDNVRAAGRKKTQRSLANRRESKDMKSESGKLEKKQVGQEPAGSEVNSVASGKWTVTALPAQTSTDRRKPAQTGEGCLYELKETSAVTCVDVVDPGKRGQKKQTKKRKLQEESPQPMNSKQRRRLERDSRKQKIGVHFYSNVKNRSYR